MFACQTTVNACRVSRQFGASTSSRYGISVKPISTTVLAQRNIFPTTGALLFRRYTTKTESALADFRKNEIKMENKLAKKRLAGSEHDIPGFQVKREVILSKQHGSEMINVTFDVNHAVNTVVSETESNTGEEQPPQIGFTHVRSGDVSSSNQLVMFGASDGILPVRLGFYASMTRKCHSIAGAASDGGSDDSVRWFQTLIDKLLAENKGLYAENKAVYVNCMGLMKDLEASEKEILTITGKLYPRGIIERFEYKNLTIDQQRMSRYKQWQILEVKVIQGKTPEEKTSFRKNFYDLCEANKFEPTLPIPDIAVNLYRELSGEIHAVTPTKITIDENRFFKQDSIFLQAVCQSLGLKEHAYDVIPQEDKTPS